MFTPLRTDRLTIRPVEPTDLDALVARRNDPETARYQSWTVPFPRDAAEQLLTGAAAMEGPEDDTWWMATIEGNDDGAIIGDLAVHPTWGGRSVEIGYNLASDQRGNGFAVEATEELVRYLFEDFGATRLSAMMHPENVASTMVAERIGFVFEGRTKLSYWVGDGDDAENTDDLLYGLVREDWDRWRARPTGRPTSVTLVDITSENYQELGGLKTHKSQERFVDPVEATFAETLFLPEIEDGKRYKAVLHGIAADDERVGAIALSVAVGHDEDPYLWRLLIDRAHQRRGIAGAALDQIEASLVADGHPSMLVSWAPGKGSPEPFYLGRGFTPTGQITDGEIEARKLL